MCTFSSSQKLCLGGMQMWISTLICLYTGGYSVQIYKDRSDIYCSVKHQLRRTHSQLPYWGVISYYVGFTELNRHKRISTYTTPTIFYTIGALVTVEVSVSGSRIRDSSNRQPLCQVLQKGCYTAVNHTRDIFFISLSNTWTTEEC